MRASRSGVEGVNFAPSVADNARGTSNRADLSEGGASTSRSSFASRASASQASLSGCPQPSSKSHQGGATKSLKALPSMSRFSMPGRLSLAELTEAELATVQHESMARVAGVTVSDRGLEKDSSLGKSRLTRANLDELSAPPLVLPRIKSGKSRRGFLGSERSQSKKVSNDHPLHSPSPLSLSLPFHPFFRSTPSHLAQLLPLSSDLLLTLVPWPPKNRSQSEPRRFEDREDVEGGSMSQDESLGASGHLPMPYALR